MKCHVHYEKDAVSQCTDCGKGMCPDCTDKFNIIICDRSNLLRIQADRQYFFKNILLMVGLFILGFFWALNETSFGQALLIGYFFAGIPWGWSVLNMITPNIFLFLPLIGWVIYFFMKAMLSAMIGAFVTPFKIYQAIQGLKKAKNNEDYTRGINA